MNICRNAGARTSWCAIGAICVAALLVGYGTVSAASESDSPLLPVRWTAAAGGDIREIQVADAHTAANTEGATQPDPECLKKYRWQPNLQKEKCGNAAAERIRLPGSASPVERPERDGGNGGGNGGGGGGGY